MNNKHSSNFWIQQFCGSSSQEIEIEAQPPKIYALTGDVNPNAINMINYQAPHFEAIFEILNLEAKQKILDDISSNEKLL